MIKACSPSVLKEVKAVGTSMSESLMRRMKSFSGIYLWSLSVRNILADFLS